jgi:drug/metabolite transporter (DMT)-like permease
LDQPTKPSSAAARSASPVLIWTAILILYVVWGSTYLAIRVAVETFPPFVMAAIRFATAGVVMIGAVAIATRGSVGRPTLREVRDAGIVGACLMFGGMGLVSWGEQTIPSGIAGVLIALMPVWIAVYGRILFGERLPGLATAGIAIAILGVVGLAAQGLAVDRTLDPLGLAALIASPLAWAAGSRCAAHRARLPENPILATGLEMLLGSAVLAVAAVLSGELAAFDPGRVAPEAIAATAYLTVVGSLVAFTAFVWVIRHAPLPLVTTYAFVNPVIAVFLGWLILHETVGPVQLAAGAVIVVGVALIILARSRMESNATETRPRHDHEDVPAAA